MIRVKRVYDKPEHSDGSRILVDRLWPRGLSKERARIDIWLKDVAPSNDLRKWFAHNPKKWAEFKKRYFKELAGKKDLIEFILNTEKQGAVSLLYGAKDEKFNNAIALKSYSESK